MSRSSVLIQALSTFALFVPAVSLADLPARGILRPSTLIEIDSRGAPNAVVTTDGKVVFRNRANGVARIVFMRADTRAFDCYADGDRVVHSRSSEYVLRRDAELTCAVLPGTYKYTTLTHLYDGIHQGQATIRVRN